ncbi:MAG TPA: cbb3-type cytochrome oxidase assembly protein CcoS [Anaeromyxobacteraceae bacterium]|nr:cbb3-type cytochrome oxidase assembly protein CcoS [Anaeromyxobacteraceae bacterium]
MSLLGLILVSLALGVLSWIGFLWSVRSGQYEDTEGPKYRMLDDDDEPPPPRPAAGAGGSTGASPAGEPGGDAAPERTGPQTPAGP